MGLSWVWVVVDPRILVSSSSPLWFYTEAFGLWLDNFLLKTPAFLNDHYYVEKCRPQVPEDDGSLDTGDLGEVSLILGPLTRLDRARRSIRIEKSPD